MTSTVKHTKLPWKVYYAKNNGQLVLGIGEADGQAITNHSGAFWRNDEEAKANSEFVVKACNSYYDLVDALQTLSKHTAIWNNPSTLKDAEVHAIVSAALSKATGEQS